MDCRNHLVLMKTTLKCFFTITFDSSRQAQSYCAFLAILRKPVRLYLYQRQKAC